MHNPVYKHIILWGGNIVIKESPDPRRVQALAAMPPPICKKELQSFLGIVNYPSKVSPITAG